MQPDQGSRDRIMLAVFEDSKGAIEAGVEREKDLKGVREEGLDH